MPPILLIALPTPLRRLFEYLPPECSTTGQTPIDLMPGVRVLVPFGKQTMVGVLVETTSTPSYSPEKLRRAIAIVDQSPILPADIMGLCLWASDYYHHPIGEVFSTALPTQLRKNTPLPTTKQKKWVHTTEGKGLPEDGLKRSPKQQFLHKLLLKHKSLTTQEIKGFGLNRSVAIALHAKQLITEQEHPEKVCDHHAENLSATTLRESPQAPNPQQQAALEKIRYHDYSTYLLDGTTGSGKTEVYLHAIARVLLAGGQALVLVPEIGLAPQTLKRFNQRFSVPIVELHSSVSTARRAKNWVLAAQGEAKIVIGTRLSVFTPMPKLGIIIIDEEHDLSFKQQDGLRYSARDIAVLRAYRQKVPLIMGSATPSLESLFNAQVKKGEQSYLHVKLTKRAGSASEPELIRTDMRKEHNQSGIAESSLKAIEETILKGQQVLVFLNRRGFAPALLCENCGWTANCTYCDAKLTLHSTPTKNLCCHHCSRQHTIPSKCPSCLSPNLLAVGQGTERCEDTLKQLFPTTEVIRVDQDSMQRKNAMKDLYAKLDSGAPCILVGTQMLSKGHHFPKVTLALILDLDHGLFSGDFRGLERMAQQIIQVAGRSGRGEHAGRVILQTYKPDHPMLELLLSKGYHAFAQHLLETRSNLHLPPIAHMAILRAESKRMENTLVFLNLALLHAKEISPPSAHQQYLGPIPALLERRDGRYRYQLQIKCSKRGALQGLMKKLIERLDGCAESRRVRWSIDVDPQDIT